jgi:hypothetical protein
MSACNTSSHGSFWNERASWMCYHWSRSLLIATPITCVLYGPTVASGAQRDSVQQATDADWLTRTRDSRCAEPFRTRPPSCVPGPLDPLNVSQCKILWRCFVLSLAIIWLLLVHLKMRNCADKRVGALYVSFLKGNDNETVSGRFV